MSISRNTARSARLSPSSIAFGKLSMKSGAEPASDETEPVSGYGTLVLDLKGRIRICSDALADLAGNRPAAFLGQPARSVLPALPINDNTPGYNIAWATFPAVQCSWHPARLLRSNGDSLLVSMAIREIGADPSQLFVLVVRWHGEGAKSPGACVGVCKKADDATESV